MKSPCPLRSQTSLTVACSTWWQVWTSAQALTGAWPTSTVWQRAICGTNDKTLPRGPRLIISSRVGAKEATHDANGVRESHSSRSGVVRADPAADAGRGPHPRKSGRRGRSVPRSVRAHARLRRTGRHRRAVPVGLHAGAEHGAGEPHLRDAARDPGISCRAINRPTRADVCRAGSVRTRARSLSFRGAGLDPPSRRIDLAPVAVARARTGGDLSLVPVGATVGWAKAPLGAVPTSNRSHFEWW